MRHPCANAPLTNWGRFFSHRHQIEFLTLPIEDMARFGVRDVEGDPKNVNPAVRRWLDLTFVALPTTLNVKTACRSRGTST
jgi:hypothetical protein